MDWMSTMAMKLEHQEQQKASSWRDKCRSGFTTLPPVLLQEQLVVLLLLERDLTSWSLAMDEHGEHKDLRGSGRRSVIPYVHGREVVLLCVWRYSRLG